MDRFSIKFSLLVCSGYGNEPFFVMVFAEIFIGFWGFEMEFFLVWNTEEWF
jgi:hypothetical protein